MVYNRVMEIILATDNLSEGAIVALKMMAGVVVAAVLLYLVIILSRVLGTKIEHAKYRKYCEKYVAEHGSEDEMLSEQDYIETRAKGNAVVWRRQDAQKIDNATHDAEDAASEETKEMSINQNANETTPQQAAQIANTAFDEVKTENRLTEINKNEEE